MPKLNKTSLFLEKNRADHRLEASFVYMLLCQDGGPIYVKVGMSSAPLKRLQALRLGCPVTPRRFAFCATPSALVSRRTEEALLEEFEPWSAHGEWFKFEPSQKPEFNAGWQRAFRLSAPNGWPLEWTHLPVNSLVDAWDQKRRFVLKLLRQQGAYQDFVRDSGERFRNLVKK